MTKPLQRKDVSNTEVRLPSSAYFANCNVTKTVVCVFSNHLPILNDLKAYLPGRGDTEIKKAVHLRQGSAIVLRLCWPSPLLSELNYCTIRPSGDPPFCLVSFPCQGHYFFNAFLHRQYPCGLWVKSSPHNIRQFFVKWPRPFLHTSQWGSKNLLSDITMKSLMVITHNKTRKCVLPIFWNLSVNMQMRHYRVPDVLQIMLHLRT